jgi:glycine/D-amino acid oxidase-like deaminating enzyme
MAHIITGDGGASASDNGSLHPVGERQAGHGPDLAGRLRTTHEERPRLSFDLDVEVCVVGAGLAGLTVARELARRGTTVAVLEGHEVGWNASGHNFGAVMPGFPIDVGDLISRVGFEDARELWRLAEAGAEYVRAAVVENPMAGVALSEGALEVSNVASGDQLISRLQTLGEDFGIAVEGWQVDRVRSVLKTPRYFHGVHYPKAFQIDGRHYIHGLATLAERAGARIFENTPVTGIDPAGIRKRIATPAARVRASQIVLAGGTHLGAPLQRLSDTLLPVWRYAALTMPLGPRLTDAVAFAGAVADADGLVQYRIVDGDRLLWCGGDSSFAIKPARFARMARRQIRTLFPALGDVGIADVFGGVIGLTVHGMPQIGAMRRGVWVASGFGRQGLNTSAMAGQLIARGIVDGDDRWRLFSPFELVWAGGTGGKFVGQAILSLGRGQAALTGVLARYRERALLRARRDEVRGAVARQARPFSRPPSQQSAPPRREAAVTRRIEAAAPQQITDVETAPLSDPQSSGRHDAPLG